MKVLQRLDAHRETDSTTSVLAAAVAAIALGRAIQVADGYFAPEAMVWLTVAAVASAVAVLGPAIRPVETWGYRLLLVILGIGLVTQFIQLAAETPAYYLDAAEPGEIRTFRLAMLAVGVIALVAFAGPTRARALATPLLLAAYLVAGVWIIRAAPDPQIDVYVFHRESITALSEGHNPYELLVENVYGPGRVDFGFPYPPTTLLLSAPGQLLFGDYRYAHVVAVAAAGALIAFARPSRVASGAAALFLFTPRTFFVLEEGWTEVWLVLLLAGLVTSAARKGKLVPYLAGGLAVAKQFGLFLVPAMAAIADRRSRRSLVRQALIAAGVAALVTLPFFFWNPERFIHNVITVHTRYRVDPEGLTFLGFWLRTTGTAPPQWIGAGLALLVGLAVALRGSRTPAGFAAGAALTVLVLFTFSAFARANHYYFSLGALWIAVAMAQPPSSARSRVAGARSSRPRKGTAVAGRLPDRT